MSRSSRRVHGDGHRVDDGQRWWKRWGWACLTTPRCRPSTRGAMRSRIRPGGASSISSSRTSGFRASSRARRSRTRSASTAPIGGSTNAVIHLLAMAGRAGVPLSLDDWDTLGRDVPTLANLMPSGQFLMEDFYYAGGVPAVMRALGEHGSAAPRRADGERQDGVGELPRRADVERRRHPSVRSAAGGAGRHRRLARQPRAGWRRAQTVGGVAAPDEASRPRRRVRQHRALQDAHQRSRARRRRRRACWCSRDCGPRGIRAWRKSATWGCRQRCSSRASRTWCASPTRG